MRQFSVASFYASNVKVGALDWCEARVARSGNARWSLSPGYFGRKIPVFYSMARNLLSHECRKELEGSWKSAATFYIAQSHRIALLVSANCNSKTLL